MKLNYFQIFHEDRTPSDLEKGTKTSDNEEQTTVLNNDSLHSSVDFVFQPISSSSPQISTDEIPTSRRNDFNAVPSLEGVRFIEVMFFINKLVEISNHCPAFGCTLANMSVVREVTRGFSSTILFYCNMCNRTYSIPTHNPENHMDVNTRAVSGIMSIGGGFSHLEEFCAAVGVPCMSTMTYSKHHNKVCDGWEKAATEQMKQAVQEEAAIARQKGNVDEFGIPLLTVIVDGTWSKRSYKNKYDALSGSATIVGFETKKILFMAVANKYCYVCARTKNETAPEHVCYKNHKGSSSSMEASIIVEGFQQSEAEHNVKYYRMIGDGDSSVYKKILEARPYKNITVEKVECRNHLLRNYRKKLIAVSENTSLGNATLRKVVNNKMSKIVSGVQKAIVYRKSESTCHQNKVIGLKYDIENGPSHVFGEHKQCAKLGYFCKGQKEGEKNVVPELVKSGLYSQITNAAVYLSTHARSLILDVDNNSAEHYNSAVVKFSGAKRINYATRRSYQGRCAAAVVAHNTRMPHYILHKTMHNGISPNKVAKKLEFKRHARIIKRRNDDKKCRRMAFKKSLAQSISDKDYGPQCQKPDMPAEVYQEEENRFLQSLIKSDEERHQIERETILQAGCGEWLEMRRKLLTASKFGRVCRMRPTTSCKNLVRSLIYSHDILNVPAIQHGRQSEEIAIKQLEEQEKIEICKAGLFIDKVQPFLAATPDGLTGEDSIVEIKCPASAYGKDVHEAMREGKIKYLKYSEDNPAVILLKKDHEYFYQVQGQLHITGREICLFGIWTSSHEKVTVLKIYRDDTFWKEKMESKLVLFYKQCLLPELVDPRHTRNMEIRDPPYIAEANRSLKRKCMDKKKTSQTK